MTTLTEGLRTAVTLTVVVGLILAVVAYLGGSSSSARSIRGATGSGTVGHSAAAVDSHRDATAIIAFGGAVGGDCGGWFRSRPTCRSARARRARGLGAVGPRPDRNRPARGLIAPPAEALGRALVDHERRAGHCAGEQCGDQDAERQRSPVAEIGADVPEEQHEQPGGGERGDQQHSDRSDESLDHGGRSFLATSSIAVSPGSTIRRAPPARRDAHRRRRMPPGTVGMASSNGCTRD